MSNFFLLAQLDYMFSDNLTLSSTSNETHVHKENKKNYFKYLNIQQKWEAVELENNKEKKKTTTLQTHLN